MKRFFMIVVAVFATVATYASVPEALSGSASGILSSAKPSVPEALSDSASGILGSANPSVPEALKAAFAEAARADYAPSDAVRRDFLRHSENGQANDVLLLQLYTSVALPDDEVQRLVSLWDGERFTDIDYADLTRGRWNPSLHITRLQALAKLYTSASSQWYRSDVLGGMIHNGLMWWYVNMPKCPNWWHNDIGIPKKVMTIMLMIRDEVSQAEIDGCLKVMERSKFGRTGQNKVWLAGNQLMKGLLTDDAALVLKARDTIAEEICMTEDEGIRDDWSFHQHGPQIQFGNYGQAYLEGLSFWIRVLEGSDYQFSEEQCGIVGNLLRNGIGWCVWKGVMDPSFCGRQVFPDGGRGKALSVAVAAQNLAAAAGRRGDSAAEAFYQAVAQENLEPESHGNSLTGAVYFPHSDCGIYRTRNWYSSVRMSSTRTIGYELTNHENTLAHFSADGAVLVMVDGREYENIFAAWDWRKIPGVTAYDDGKPIRETDVRELKENHSDNVWGRIYNENGGEVLEACMEVSRDSLHALKHIRFTPDAIFEWGEEIYTLNPDVVSVTTAIDQNNYAGRVRRGRRKGREWVWHNGIGYVVLDGNHINVTTDVQTGDWGKIDPAITGRIDSRRVFKAWIEHSEALVANSGNAEYSFVILPDVTAGQTRRFAKTYKR